MITNTSAKIILYVRKHKSATAKEIQQYLKISYQATIKQLNRLVKQKTLSKNGKPPKVFYTANPQIWLSQDEVHYLDSNVIKILDDNFLYITASGDLKYGVEGFKEWVKRNKYDFVKGAFEYVQKLRDLDATKTRGVYNGLQKLSPKLGEIHLDAFNFIDCFSIGKFGKTKLGNYLLYAKQSQHVELMHNIFKEIDEHIKNIISFYNIDAVGFIPPTIPRKVQLQKEIRHLKYDLPEIQIKKAKNDIIVPQKTLDTIEERVENIQNTVFVSGEKYNNVLLIDDEAISGATLNETAKKIKEKGLAKHVVGLSLVANLLDFKSVEL